MRRNQRGGGDNVRELLAQARSANTTGTVDAGRVRQLIVEGRYTKERACDTKARFSFWDHANKAKHDLELKHGDPGKLEIYPCPFCAGFHLATAEEFK